uniref:Sushi domain-containing protein n=1 Tax=Acrobeloides nanus TaxID=290746 RepID=A0A914CLV1_9BILA
MLVSHVKYAYRKGSKHENSNKQTLICNGDTRKLDDREDSSNTFAVPKDCVRSGQNECQEIQQNPETSIVNVKNCIKDGDYYPTGCQIEVSCKPGYYPADDDYQKGKGTQKLTCQSGGRGWFDQFYQRVNKPLQCIEGCIKREIGMSSYKSTNTVTTNYVINGETISCSTYELYKNHSVISGLVTEHNYYCAAENKQDSEHSFVDKSCTNACAQLESSLPIGVKLYKVPVIQRVRAPNGKYYIANKGEYVVKCDTGYQYKSDSIHFKKRRQVLRCAGNTHEYDDIDTKEKTIVPCEESNGCEEIRQDSTRTIVTLRGCSKRGNLLSAGCEVIISCKRGSYPQPDQYLFPGDQRLKCSADGSGWVDQFGDKVSKPLKCNDGCVNPLASTTIEKIRELKESYVNQEFTLVLDEKGNTITRCVTVESARRILEEREKVQKSDHSFYCNLEEKIKNETSEYYYDDFCENACTQLLLKLPPNVELSNKPESFKHGIRSYVREGDAYELKCKAGFMYPGFTTSSRTGRQKLVCNGPSHRYDDADSRLRNSPILSCVEVQGCAELPAPKVGTVINKVSCTKQDGLYRYGCKITTFCEEGHYPIDESLLSSGSQDLYCNTGSDSFADEQGNAVSQHMECQPGCIDKGHSIFKKIESSMKREFTTVIDEKGNVVSKCASVESIRRESELRSKLNQRFLCAANTNEVDKTSSYYVDYCENACRVLQEPLPYGLRIIKKPFIFRHSDFYYSASDSTYQLACQPGFVFASDSLHAQRDVMIQSLKCEGKTHKYVDTLDSTNTLVSACVKVEGCKALRKPGRGMIHNQDQCNIEGKGIVKGCEVFVSCEAGYYPANERYLIAGKQILRCASDGSGWVDQFGMLVKDAVQCKKGCVKRGSGFGSVTTDRTSIEQTYNFISDDKIVQIYCSYKSVSENVDSYYLGEEHGFYCKSEKRDESHLSLKNVTISPCSNACKSLVATTSVQITMTRRFFKKLRKASEESLSYIA